MEFHDYRLRGYQVSHFGSVITLELLYDYPEEPKRESIIRFDGVRLYHLVHPAGAIITDIEEAPLEALLRDHATEIADWAKRYGVKPSLVAEWNNVKPTASFKHGETVTVYLPVRMGGAPKAGTHVAPQAKSAPQHKPASGSSKAASRPAAKSSTKPARKTR